MSFSNLKVLLWSSLKLQLQQYQHPTLKRSYIRELITAILNIDIEISAQHLMAYSEVFFISVPQFDHTLTLPSQTTYNVTMQTATRSVKWHLFGCVHILFINRLFLSWSKRKVWAAERRLQT